MSTQKSAKTTRKQKRPSRSPQGHISCSVRPSKLEGQPGSIRLSIPGGLRKSGKQELIHLGLAATLENLASVRAVLAAINVRVHTRRELNVHDMTKEDLKNHILNGLGQPEQLNAKPKAQVDLGTLLLSYMDYKRSVLHRSESHLAVCRTTYNVVTKLPTTDLSKSAEILKELAKLEYALYYRTVQHVSACCGWAVAQEEIHKNPFLRTQAELTAPKPTDTHPDPFSRQAMERIIRAYGQHPLYSHYEDFVKFKFLTGARTGEVAPLLWSDIDFEKGVIYIRKSMTLVSGKHCLRDQTKTNEDREFPIEDPALLKLLKRRYSQDGKPENFVFQEPKGSHVNLKRFYYSWYGCNQSYMLKNGTKKECFTRGIVSKLAELKEEEGGIDYYRPPYNTRHTFITLVVEGLINLGSSTLRDIQTLADYVGNSAEIILKHYLLTRQHKRMQSGRGN